MSGLAIATSYEESVGSCGPPIPTTPPTPASAAPRHTPVRRQLDFSGGGGLDGEDDDEFLCRLADDIERRYGEAKLRAPPCVCGRGVCDVERDEQGGRWKYVCPSWPKCKHVAFCEEVDLNPKSEPTSRSYPKPSSPCAFNDPSNPCAFNDPNNHMTGQRTPVNVRPQGASVATLINVSQEAEIAATPTNNNPQGAGSTAPPKFIPQRSGAITPVKVSPQGAGAVTPVKVSFQGSRFNGEGPVCQCTAGKCTKSRMGEEDYYVCPIPKGKGACSYKVRVCDVVTESPCDEVHQESPSMLHRPIAAVNTPSKSPMRPYGTPSPISRKPDDICFLCHENGHWRIDCPKQPRRDGACFTCGMVGHWSPNCPQRKGS